MEAQPSEPHAATVEPNVTERPGLQRAMTISHVRDYGIIAVVVALFVVLSVTAPSFFTVRNLLNVLQQNAAIGIISCGATLVIIGADLDLSVGSVFIVTGVVAAWGANHFSVPVGELMGILAGGVLGVINGTIVTVFRVSSFLATLATGLAFAGAAVAITKGIDITVTAASFGTLGNGGIGEVAYAVMIFAGVALAGQLVLSRSVFGRHLYGVGGNREAARNAGVRVNSVRMTAFIISGLAAGLAGVIGASMVLSGSTTTGSQYALASVAAIALGGTSIFGGVGAMWRTVLGVILLALITNGFNLLGVASYYQNIVEGAVIVLAVAINSLAAES